jgi:glycosyltransferase involved in cell wall biosynthesis
MEKLTVTGMNPLNVLIVSGCPHATTKLYRCLHLQEQLTCLGHRATVRDWDGDIERQTDTLLAYDLAILQRVPITRPLRHTIDQMQAQGSLVVFDTDDLVFEPGLALWHRAVQQLPQAEQHLYHDGVRRYAATLDMSDAVLVSSPLLADLARLRHKPAFVLRNGFGREMTDLAQRLYAERRTRTRTDRLVIGYGSGTATHDADFQEVVPALLHVLATYPQVDLWLVGPLQLPGLLQPFVSRIHRRPLVPWQRWFETASHFDINLAPLENDNPFCRAKSAIKFTEAAALGIPTVASRTDPFEDAIRHGETGYLAHHTSDWIDALDRLIAQPNHRREMGEAAREDVRVEASLEKRAEELASILAQITERRERSAALVVLEPSTQAEHPMAVPLATKSDQRTPLVINWIVSEPIPGSGGFTNIFRIISYLSLFGHECRIYIVPVERLRHATVAEIERFVTDHFSVKGARFYRWDGTVEDADATFATYWETAYQVAALNNGGRGYYLIQDFEPFFYPVGIQHMQAEGSYHLGLHALTLGHWLARFLHERYGAIAHAFDFALDRDIFRPLQTPEPERPPRIVFYARPSTPRRGYEIGIAALKLVHAARPDVEIVLYGSTHLPTPPDFYHHNVGILNPYELARLYATADIGLVLSFTNPSLTPLEMMACGCAVVDIASERMEGLLHNGVDSLLTQPDPRAIAESILQLLHEKELRQKLVENGYQQVNQRSWEASVRQIEQLLLDQIPAEERIRAKPYQNREADALIWQIHQLLDRRTQTQVQVSPDADRLDKLLTQTIEAKAQRTNQLQAKEDQLHRLIGQNPIRQVWGKTQQTIEPLIKGGRAQIGDLPLYAKSLVGAPLHQRFVADRSHLARIELLPTAPFQIATRPLRLTLHCGDETGPIVAEQIYSAADLAPNQILVFDFETQTHSFQQTYTLVLSSPGSTASDHHRFWCFDWIYHPQATLQQNQQTVIGQLAFQWYSRPKEQWLAPHTGPAGWGAEVQLHPDKMSFFRSWIAQNRRLGGRGFGALRTGGIAALGGEIRTYLRWRLDQLRDRLGW